MIRTLFVIIWVVLVTCFLGTGIILVSFFSKDGNLIHSIARLWAISILAASRISVTVKGLSNIGSSNAYIFMSNHQSNFDIPVLMAHLPVQSRWLAKAELFKIPLFGYAMKRAGYINIDRSNLRSAIISIKKAAKIVRNGVSVLIFPEGTRSQDGNIKPFKKGGFILAVESSVPVIPVTIYGTWPIMPKGHIRIRPGNVILEIGTPIETINYTKRTKDDLLEKVRRILCESFEKINKDKL